MNDLERQRWLNLGERFAEEEECMTEEEREERMRRILENLNPSIPRTFIRRVEE